MATSSNKYVYSFRSIDSVIKYVNDEQERISLPGIDKSIKLISVKIVKGGISNFVYRLTFSNGSSFVLKHYPPYLASVELMPMSQLRYRVEKEALQTLSNEEKLRNSIVKTPRVLHYDDTLFVLIMEDCGQNLVSLFEYLKRHSNRTCDQEVLAELAKELHRFLCTINNDISIKASTHAIPFENKSAWSILNDYCLPLFASQAKCLHLENELSAHLSTSHRFEQPKENACFVVGDLWPKSILIDLDKHIFWTLDWEMARFERPLRDLEQLNANLWIMKQNEEIFDSDCVDFLMRRLQYEYFGSETADWRVKCGREAKTNFIFWTLNLLKEKHWGIDNTRSTILKALDEVNQL